jgi:antitoxin component YwqK of YwqJK toxin-antitoxin module
MLTVYKKSNDEYIKYDKHEELILQFYESGNTKRMIPYYNGKVHGVIVDWYNSGTIRSELPVQRGKAHGVNRNYSGLGRLELEFTFTNGKVSCEYHIFTRRGGFSGSVITKNIILLNIDRATSDEIHQCEDLRLQLSAEAVSKIN